MGWKENRRRNRTWYKHYKGIADDIARLCKGPQPIAAEALVGLFFALYERRRLHGKRRVAESAFESLKLACSDAALGDASLQARTWPAGTRPTSQLSFDLGVRTSQPTSKPVQPNSRGQYLSDIAAVARIAGETVLKQNTLRDAVRVLGLNNPPTTELVIAARVYSGEVYDKDVLAEPMIGDSTGDSTKEKAREAESRPDTEIPF